MPASSNARTRLVTEVPYSEAAMHARIAGNPALLTEEDRLVNGKRIPVGERHGCYATPVLAGEFRARVRIPLLKSEAGWE